MLRFSLKRGLIKALLVMVLIISFGIIIKNKTEVDTASPDKKSPVPNEKTAIDIAKAIWLPAYGKKVLE